MATSVGISIISFGSIVGAPAGAESADFSLALSLTTGTLKKMN